MRCAALSDLHVEFAPIDTAALRADLESREVELVLLAGDLAPVEEVAALADAIVPSTARGLLVMGNHEPYDQHRRWSIDRALERLRADLGTVARLRLLEDEVAVPHPELRVFGATLWSDFRLAGSAVGPALLADYAACMNDYRMIADEDGEALHPTHTARRHQRSRAALERALAIPFTGRTLVLSHHAPLSRNSPPRYRGDPASPLFVAAMEDVIERFAIDTWVSGHTHYSCDFVLGTTRFVSAQRGYPGESPEPFVPAVFEP
ncbi:MAG: metallophosphoesterase [Erythrobacter sp.]